MTGAELYSFIRSVVPRWIVLRVKPVGDCITARLYRFLRAWYTPTMSFYPAVPCAASEV